MALFDRLRSPAPSGDPAAAGGPAPSAAQLLEQGMALEQLGRMDDALQHYALALGLQPELARAHFNRGNILLDRGDAQGALEAYVLAARYKPDSAGTHFNLGAAFAQLDRRDDAVAAYRQAIALKPDFAQAHIALANTLEELGQDSAAVDSYRHALQTQADDAQTIEKLASLLKKLGRLDETADCYRQLLRIEPDSVDTLNKLGALLKELGQLNEAVSVLHKALAINPKAALVHNNLGTAFRGQGQLDDAVRSYRRALDLQPDFAQSHHNLANALTALGQTELALDSFRRALEIKPDLAETHTCLGVALHELGRFEEAVASHQQALALKPDYAFAHGNLGLTLQELGQFDASFESTLRALEIDPDFSEAYDCLLFTHNYLADQPAAYLFSLAMRYGDSVARRARPQPSWSNEVDPKRRLRVGLVSGDLSNHPVGFFLEGILVALARSELPLTLFAYPTRICNDGISQVLKACCEEWRSIIGISDAHVADQIRADGIDILIDLSGHTAHNRLPVFAWRPAPIQVSWLGYFATTGVSAMDYLIADPWTLPVSDEHNFTERIWRLPETRLCFTPPRSEVVVSSLPALHNRFVTFGCFNNLSKMNDAVVALWARILNALPSSRLFLKARQIMNASVRQSVIHRFANHGIGEERLILEEYVPRENYLAAYQQVDIALDPFPYPGGTTTVESLWMGVPVLTLAGDRFLSRQGVGLLTNAGLPEWVATDPDDYFARAVSHASDLQALAKLRAGLRSQVLGSPIFDAPRFATHFEAALRGMWDVWCEKHAARPTDGPRGA